MHTSVSDCTEFVGDLRRDIQVSDGEVDKVGEGLQVTKAAGAILDDFDNAVDAFGNGVGYTGFDERENSALVASCGGDEPTQGLQAATQGCGRPSIQEALCGPDSIELPQLLELVLETPRPIDPAVMFLQQSERARVTA